MWFMACHVHTLVLLAAYKNAFMNLDIPSVLVQPEWQLILIHDTMDMKTDHETQLSPGN